MINQSSIIYWRNNAPWNSDAQVEQDLIISRALIEIFLDPFLSESLAFRGGTALQKLFYEQATRYSEDLDFVQINAEGIGPMIDALRLRLDVWLGEPKRISKEGRLTLLYRYQSVVPELKMKLKIEINTREHFNLLGQKRILYGITSPWYIGQAQINTYQLEELLGTKLRALYQRKKGRDLFDLAMALRNLNFDKQKVVDCFNYYIDKANLRISRAEFEKNLALKAQDPAFKNDINSLLASEFIRSDFEEDVQKVKDSLLCLLSGEPWKG